MENPLCLTWPFFNLPFILGVCVWGRGVVSMYFFLF